MLSGGAVGGIARGAGGSRGANSMISALTAAPCGSPAAALGSTGKVSSSSMTSMTGALETLGAVVGAAGAGTGASSMGAAASTSAIGGAAADMLGAGNSASTFSIAVCKADASGVTRPFLRSVSTQTRKLVCAVSMSPRTAAEAGRSSSINRLCTFSTAKAISPSSVRPTMRPLPLSVWKPLRTVVSASRSSG